jgi:hypothetical protein
MSNKKQTAVEWLEKQLQKEEYIEKIGCVTYIINQAKEMEKQQIINADLNGSIRTAKAIDYRITQLRIKELAEQYYNETFNKD